MCPVQRSFSSLSNASSDYSDPSAVHSAQQGSTAAAHQRASNSGLHSSIGHSGNTAGLNDPYGYLQGTWSKGMPPSGKKKKDAGSHMAAMVRLI